ncbi:MAG: hypothetical protein QXW79_01205 [Thermoplasmata archaeon]
MVNLCMYEDCPFCHHTFIAGFDPRNLRVCPSCKNAFISGQKPKHDSSCIFCSNKYKGTNNIYYLHGCPAIMADGRFVTYYNSTNEITENMKKVNGFHRTNDFRNFMQKNGVLFIEAERDYHIRKHRCSPSFACSMGWYDLWVKYHGDWTKQWTDFNHKK